MSDRFYGVVEWCAGALPGERVADVARLLELAVAYQAAAKDLREAHATHQHNAVYGRPPAVRWQAIHKIGAADSAEHVARAALLKHAAGEP